MVILRYEAEARQLVNSVKRANEVRVLRVERQGTWRYVGEECQHAWGTDVGEGDTQSLGATLCHVSAEMLGEDPNADPWQPSTPDLCATPALGSRGHVRLLEPSLHLPRGRKGED